MIDKKKKLSIIIWRLVKMGVESLVPKTAM
jgi:hypothetical protein